jgi:hypothetical protein
MGIPLTFVHVPPADWPTTTGVVFRHKNAGHNQLKTAVCHVTEFHLTPSYAPRLFRLRIHKLLLRKVCVTYIHTFAFDVWVYELEGRL